MVTTPPPQPHAVLVGVQLPGVSDEEHAAEVLYTLYRPVLEQTFQAPPYLPRPEG